MKQRRLGALPCSKIMTFVCFHERAEASIAGAAVLPQPSALLGLVGLIQSTVKYKKQQVLSVRSLDNAVGL